MIAMDRYKIIVNPFSAIREGSGKKLRMLIITFTWILCGVISSVPFIPFNVVDDYDMIPSDICFIHLYENYESLYITIYANVLYGVAIPVAYCIVIGKYIRMVFKLRESTAIPGRSDSTPNYSKVYIRFAAVCTSYLVSFMTFAIITYVADADASMATTVANGALLVLNSVPPSLNPFVHTITTSFVTDYFKDKKPVRLTF